MRRFLETRIVALALIAAAGITALAAADDPTAERSPATRPAPQRPGVKEWLRLIPKGAFAAKPANPPPRLPEKIDRAYVIPLKGGITGTLAEILQSKIATCKSRAQIVVFDVNSGGGEMKAMQEIVSLIREDLREVYTVAYVHTEAISAAAIIAMACDEIVFSPIGKLGDAMPVLVGPQGYVPIPKKERGKIESYARADIRVQAKLSGYNLALCEAMVTQSREVWLIKNRRTGELRIVDARDYRGKVARAPFMGSAVPPDAPLEVQILAKAVEAAAGEGEDELPWQFLALIDGPEELVTMTADEAVGLGFARNVFKSMDELRQHYNIVAEPDLLEDNWSERLVAFLTSPAVTMLLFLGGLVCLYSEMRMPGFGILGILGILCFAVLFGSRYLIGLAQWWEIGLFLLGLVLIAVEVFVIPGFGVVGIAGIICCIIGLVAIVVPNAPGKLPIPKTDLDWSMFEGGMLALAIGFVLAVPAGMVAAKFLPKIPGASKLVLVPAGGGTGTVLSDASPVRRIKPGDVGTVEGMCRPVGKVRFGQDLLDATSEGDTIEVGAKVRVLRQEGNHLIVERAEGT